MEEEQRRVPAEVQVDGMRLWLYDGVEEYLRPPQSEAVLARRAPELRAWLDELRARVPLRVYLAIGRGQQRGTALVVVRGGTRAYQIDAYLPGPVGQPLARGYLGMQHLDAGDGRDGDYARETWDDIAAEIARGEHAWEG